MYHKVKDLVNPGWQLGHSDTDVVNQNFIGFAIIMNI